MDEYPTFDEVAAAKQILVELKQRLQRLQLREARQGESVDVGIFGEIDALTVRISAQEKEVQQIETQAAVDKWSLAEAKYRELLAETWDNERGLPTTVGLERLERVRLEFGIKPVRAKELEQDIRTRLAKDAFLQIDRWLLYDLDSMLNAMIRSGKEEIPELPDDRDAPSLVLLRQLGKATRLDPDITLRMFKSALYTSYIFNRKAFRTILLMANNVWDGEGQEEEMALFQRFLHGLFAPAQSSPPA